MNNTNEQNSLQNKLKAALAYLGNKHVIAKDSKFAYCRFPVVLKGNGK